MSSGWVMGAAVVTDRSEASDDVWARALGSLASAHPAAIPALRSAVARLRSAGGVPFEVIAGTPAEHYGARLTFRAERDGDAALLAASAGLGDHPWGTPDWIGVRTSADGSVRCKAYHRRPPALGFATVHRGLPDGVNPVMAALDADALEIYAVEPGQAPWATFLTRCLAGLGLNDGGVDFAPRPIPRARGFGVSTKEIRGRLTAVTVYAFPTALPEDDRRVTAEWTATMQPQEKAAYLSAVAAVDSIGRRAGRRHGLLAWTFDATGLVSRAASFHARFVRGRQQPPG